MRQQYIEKKLRKASYLLIAKMNEILADYMAQGYVMTVRQLYYELVGKGIIENTLPSYKNLASLINDARLLGLMDWDVIEDRTRAFISRPSWGNPQHFLDAVLPQYHTSQWTGQDSRVFVVIEKEALVGVLEGLCRRYDVPILAARGYPSASVLRDFCQNTLLPIFDNGIDVTILHCGDHDPSGIDMTRDLRERIELFCGDDGLGSFSLERIALNYEQIEELQPPPNPAKITDSRFDSYARLYGDESWELDAVGPRYLNNLVEKSILEQIDPDVWKATQDQMDEEKLRLEALKDKL